MEPAVEGFEEFVRIRSSTLLRRAYLLCAGDRAAAEDLLQEVLERMYPRWPSIRADPETYARAALANAAANRWRYRSRRVRETPLPAMVEQPDSVDGPECRAFGEPRPIIDAPARAFVDGLRDWGALDGRTIGYGAWCVAVRLDDGSTILVSEVQEDERPSRLFALTTAADGTPTGVQVGDSIDPSAQLPVAIRLADGHGWAVAAYGSDLAYRTTVDGDWIEAGTDAALLPDPATEVRVTGEGGLVVVAL